MKRALVLCGGGSRGAYEAGFIEALSELGFVFDIVCGTSIGALNGCLVSMGKIKELSELWDHISISSVIKGDFNEDFKLNLENLIDSRNLVISFFKSYIKEKGADITPLKQLISQYLDEDLLLSSPVEFGLCTVMYPSLKPLYISKSNMKKENIGDYLLASASVFPVFPIHHFNDEYYLDGGYYDNLPIDFALELGADEIIAIDLKDDVTHSHYLNRPNIDYIVPYYHLGMMFDFSKESILRNKRAGYNDCMKRYGHYKGMRYTFTDHHCLFLKDYYKDYMLLDKQIRRTIFIDSHKKFLDHHKGTDLIIDDYFYICLDWILELMGKDETYVYCLEDLLEEIKDYFKVVNHEERFHKMINSNKIEYIKKCIDEMTHNQGVVPSSLIMPIFIKELIMARFIYFINNK